MKDNEPIRIDSAFEKQIKLIHAFDSKCFRYQFLFSAQSCKLDALAAELMKNRSQCIYVNNAETISQVYFKEIYGNTCLFTTTQIYMKFKMAINAQWFIKHVFLIQLQQNESIELGRKAMIVNETEFIDSLAYQPADNFLRYQDQQAYKDTILTVLQENLDVRNSLEKVRAYLIILGLTEEEIASMSIKFRQGFLQNGLLRIYSSVYQCYFINCLLRRCSEKPILELIAPLISKISLAIGTNSQLQGEQVCYRGGEISEGEAKWLAQRVKQEVVCRYFMSCSLSDIRAEDFRINCLFKIIFANKGYAVLGKRSEYAEEQEVLFNILSRFEVLEVRLDRARVNRSWHVTLRYLGTLLNQ